MNHRYWVLSGAIVLTGSLVLSGCGSAEDDGEYARTGDVGASRPHAVALVERGQKAYAEFCVGCHGEKGDGNGEAAKFFSPKPRNFTLAEYKFSSTRSGELPTDDDLRRTIKNGLRGSAMPPFELLPETTVDALIAYIKTFSPVWKERGPSRPIPFVDDPYLGEADLSEAIARGEKIYHGYATCWTCHPSYITGEKINAYRKSLNMMEYEEFRPQMTESVGKENTQGEVIFPPDFHRDWVRAGMSVKDIYRSVAAGITGTAMPTWADSMELAGSNDGDQPLVQPADLWAVAYYVQSLIKNRPLRLQEPEIALRDRTREIYLHGEPPKKKVEPAKDESAPAENFDF